MVAILVGMAAFAAFESHVVNVKAHVEKATYVTPNELDFGVTLMHHVGQVSGHSPQRLVQGREADKV